LVGSTSCSKNVHSHARCSYNSRHIVLSLGQFDEVQRLARRQQWVDRLLEMYRDDPDAGMHSAAEWVLRSWKEGAKVEQIDRKLKTGRVEGKRHWYINRQGQTLVLVPPGEFETEAAVQGKRVQVRVERRFGLAVREVTVAEFLRFRKDHKYAKESAPTEDCPVNMVSWYDTAAHCNWLNKQEGIAEDQWCYVSNEKDEKGDYAEGMTVKANALSLSGYRLPAEAEWELACRAGSVTPWSMGEAVDLLRRYAWYAANSPGRSRPVGSLRPNDLGLFDLHGNAWEWCNNRHEEFTDIRDRNTDDKVDNKGSRSLRGGGFAYYPLNLRSASRYWNLPAVRYQIFGFRPARTFR
jgi:formylglycine-generating enzyme required for sulfatase activity